MSPRIYDEYAIDREGGTLEREVGILSPSKWVLEGGGQRGRYAHILFVVSRGPRRFVKLIKYELSHEDVEGATAKRMYSEAAVDEELFKMFEKGEVLITTFDADEHLHGRDFLARTIFNIHLGKPIRVLFPKDCVGQSRVIAYSPYCDTIRVTQNHADKVYVTDDGIEVGDLYE